LVVLSSQFAPYFDFKFVLCFFVGRGFCRWRLISALNA
jgi:hypothetical protein